MKKIFSTLMPIVAILALGCKKENTPEKTWALYDIDKNGYDTVKIGTQFWTKQNLNTSHYRNGDPIPQITSASIWSSLTTGAWCWYNNDSATYAATYGKLYNLYAVNDPRGLAPQGWHIPAKTEYESLITSLGGFSIAGGALKEMGNAHWASPNNATNNSRFTALPGGYVSDNGVFALQGEYGFFWASITNGPLVNALQLNNSGLGASVPFGSTHRRGHSIRCIKD